MYVYVKKAHEMLESKAHLFRRILYLQEKYFYILKYSLTNFFLEIYDIGRF